MADPSPFLFNAEPARRMWKENFALMHLLVASAILLWASLENAPARYVWFGEGRQGLLSYAVVVAAVSLSLCGLLVIGLMTVGDQDLRKTLFHLPRFGPVNMSLAIAVAFAVWWSAAAGVLTFGVNARAAPYGTLSNGYFALWFGTACSIAMVGKACGHPIGLSPLLCNFVCSIMVLLAAIFYDNASEPTVTWAICLGAISCAIHLLLFLRGVHKLGPNMLKALALLLLLLWTPGTLVLTFKGPFISVANTSNGYFSAWFGLLSALSLAADHL